MRRLMVFVGALVLVDLMFYAAITPLLPQYSDQFDLTKTGAGVLAGTYAAGTLLGALPSGWLATRLGARRTVLVGLALMSTASVGFAFGHTIVVLDTMRFVQGFGGACTWAGGFGWLLSLTPREERGATIGAVMGAALVGILLGPVLGVIARAVGPEIPFTSIAVLGAILALVARRLTPPVPTPVVKRQLSVALRRPGVRGAMGLILVPALLFGAFEVLVPLRLDALGASAVAIGATFLVDAAIEAVLQPLIGHVSDRHGRIWPIRICLASSLVFMLLLPLPQAAWLLAAIVMVGGAITGAINTPAMAMLSDDVEAAELDQGFGFALTNLVWASGQVIGTIVGASLAHATSDTVTYLALAAICAVALVRMLRPAQAPALVADRA